MRDYRQYAPDQAALLPPSFAEVIPADDPVFFIRDVVGQLDLSAFHHVYRAERGRPPYHPELMVGLYLYGGARRIYSSRRLAEACARDVSFIYLAGRATPDHHTICEFRQRFTKELKDLFVQVLLLCQEAGLVRLGHISLDGTKMRANASKHKAMSYGRMVRKEPELAAEVERLLGEGRRQDEEDDAVHGPHDDGWSMPPELRETKRRLEKIRAGKQRLEESFRRRAAEKGKDPEQAVVPDRAQTNFTDPESRIMSTTDGFQQCYNAQAAVDAAHQVIVACEVSNAPPDVQRLVPMLQQIHDNTAHFPNELSADAGYASEANFTALAEADILALVAMRRYHRDEPPDADPAAKRATGRQLQRNIMRDRLSSAEGKMIYKLRKQTVEPVFGQIKGARGFRQFLRRGQTAVESEWSVLCTVHNVLKLFKAKHPKPAGAPRQPPRASCQPWPQPALL
ncbi:MAG: IS1182 family transposase [Chloroflexi bacterium]|nr:IS1182 family transposase [Chloroflexota bacterium]